MDSPALEQRPGRIRAFLSSIERFVSRSYTIQSLLLLHCLSWSAESRTHLVTLIIGVLTILFFYGCKHFARLIYETAVLFSVFALVLKGFLWITIIFALYEVVLNILGYHSADYKKLQHNIQLLFTEFNELTCNGVLNTTTDGVVVLDPNDVINLCHTIWYILYIVTLAMGIYMAMPNLDGIRKAHFWTNVYFTVLMVVVWKIFETFLLYGIWLSTEFKRVACVYVQYTTYGEAGFYLGQFHKNHE